MNPSLFDLKFEGIVLFDRNDGLLRNEIASHIFYDRKEKLWRGLTTGLVRMPISRKETVARNRKYQRPSIWFFNHEGNAFWDCW
jgi:hypothetical protein